MLSVKTVKKIHTCLKFIGLNLTGQGLNNRNLEYELKLHCFQAHCLQVGPESQFRYEMDLTFHYFPKNPQNQFNDKLLHFFYKQCICI